MNNHRRRHSSTHINFEANGERTASCEVKTLATHGSSIHDVVRVPSVLGIEQSHIEDQFIDTYTHDWHDDPYAPGAYRYVKVGSSAS